MNKMKSEEEYEKEYISPNSFSFYKS